MSAADIVGYGPYWKLAWWRQEALISCLDFSSLFFLCLYLVGILYSKEEAALNVPQAILSVWPPSVEHTVWYVVLEALYCREEQLHCCSRNAC